MLHWRAYIVCANILHARWADLEKTEINLIKEACRALESKLYPMKLIISGIPELYPKAWKGSAVAWNQPQPRAALLSELCSGENDAIQPALWVLPHMQCVL